MHEIDRSEGKGNPPSAKRTRRVPPRPTYSLVCVCAEMLSCSELVGVCSSFGLTASEAKTGIMCLETKSGGKVSFTINAAGQVYKQTIQFAYLGGAITADRNLSTDITRRLQRAWACFQRYKMEIYDRPGVCLRLKVRLLKAEVVETLLYGCMTWSPKKPDYDRLRRVHRSMLLRCLGHHKIA